MFAAHRTHFSMAYRWFLLYLVYLISALTAFSMFKAPPVFPQLIVDLGFTEANIGWMTSMFAIIGAALAFPASALVNKLGYTKSLLLTLAAIIIGSLLGVFSKGLGLMLVSRVFEGASMGLISVVGPAAVSQIMPIEKQGFAQGMYSTWFPFGSVIALNASPIIAGVFGWQGAWVTSIVAAVILTVLVVVFFTIPPAEKPAPTQEAHDAAVQALSASGKPAASIWPPIIFGSLCLFFWNSSYCGAIASFFPTFLQEAHGLSPQYAGFLSSLTPMLILLTGPLAGFVSDRFDMQKGLMVFANVMAIVLLYLAFSSNMTLVWVYIILFSFAAGSMPAGLYALVPRTTQDPKAIAVSMSIIAVCMNLGIMLGAGAFGPLQLAVGWQNAALYFLCPFAVISLAMALLIRPIHKKKQA